jgi:hypothetical protein
MGKLARNVRRVVVLGSLVVAAMSVASPAEDAWAIWAQHSPQNAAVVDHTPWQGFLDEYLVVHPGGVNRMAYRRVTDTDRQRLGDYLDSLSQIDPRRYRKAEQLAYWINLYNALTVQVVLAHPAKDSILRMGRGLLSFGPWDDVLISVADHPVTLNDIEHRILRPIWRDHRVHYAVNCASVSCPNLAPRAYTAENTEALFASGESDYINHERGVRFDRQGRLLLSQIYAWYEQDFAADTAGLGRYLSAHHRTAAEALAAYGASVEYHYDWALNQAKE